VRSLFGCGSFGLRMLTHDWASAFSGLFGLQACLLQPSVMVLGYSLPTPYATAMLAGQATSTVLVSGLRVGAKVLLNSAPNMGGAAFLIVAAVLQLACAMATAYVARTPFVRYHCARAASRALLDDETATQSAFSTYSDDLLSPPEAGWSPPKRGFFSVIRPVWRQALSLWLALVVTFSLFPGEITSMWMHDPQGDFSILRVRACAVVLGF